MNKETADHVPGDLMRYAPSHDLQKRGYMGLPGIAPDDPRYLIFGGMKAENYSRPTKVYATGSCFSCGYLPENTAHPPKFCTECGAKFIPVEPENAMNQEETI